MTNPNNAVGTNGAYNGRTSVNALNDIMGAFTKGVVSGWNCTPKSGMTVSVGGDGSTRDVAIAEDNAGNKTSINNISGQPIDVTIPAAPATGNRIDLIVAYVENPPQGDPAQVDNFQACGLITVSGTAASTPVAPNDTTIRNAITSDGATGATAYYVVLAQITVGTGVTTIGAGVITQGAKATLGDGTVTADSIDFDSFKPQWKVVATSTTRTVSIPLDYRMYRISFCYTKSSSATWGTIACPESSGNTYIYIQGVTNGTWVQAERNFAASGDKAVMDGARNANVPSGSSQWRIQLARASTTTTSMNAMWQTMTNASLTYNTGRSTFSLSSGTGSMTLQAETGSGHLWIVEALDV